MGGDRVQRSGRASGWTRDSLFLLDDCVLLCVLWGDPLQDQQTGEGQRDPDPPQRYFSFTKDQLPKECLQTKRSTVLTPICSTHTTNPPKQEALTEEMKLEAAVVTVVQVEEDEYLRALARTVHMPALQVKSRPPHSSLRGMWSWDKHRHA